MADRYFVESPISGDRAVLVGQEAHHLAHVMRAKPGTEVTLFDGSGAEFAARVLRVNRAEVELAVVGRQEVDRELPLELVLAVALPKGDRQKWLVEKAVELGVARLVPLATARSVAEPAETALKRLRRTVIEASKQCGRNRLMEIAAPEDWAGLLEATAGAPCRLLVHPRNLSRTPPALREEPSSRRNLADGEEESSRRSATSSEEDPSPRDMASRPEIWRPGNRPESVYAAIGPEGGFTEDEVRLALDAGWRPIDLGPRILRVETAALVVAAVIGGRLA
jgi:16S rRNA (uracil1498-N3)-methyltransferase